MKKLTLVILSSLAAPLFLFSVVLFGSIIILLSFLTTRKAVLDYFIEKWVLFSLFIFRVKVKSVQGLQHIPKGACLFMFNHTSHFDILTLQSIVPRIRFGAKIELFSFPVFGTAMRRAGVLPIARNRIEEVKKIYSDAELRTARGECFALAPEGTRQASDTILGPFKSGPFIFALNAGIPIVPVVIKGCHDVLPKNKILPSTNNWVETVSVTFGPAIMTNKKDKEKAEAKTFLQQKTRQWMEAELMAYHQAKVESKK